MNIRLAQWGVAVGLVAAGVAAVTLPFPLRPDEELTPVRARTQVAFTQYLAARREMEGTVRQYRATQALERYRASRAGGDGAVTIDRSVPVPARAALDSVARRAIAQAGPSASPAAIGVFFYLDTSTIAHGKRYRESSARASQSFAFPSATGNSRCVVLVRLESPDAPGRDAVGPGPCAIVARFGEAGAGVARWLTSLGYSPARVVMADAPPGRDAPEAVLIRNLNVVAGSCALRGGEWCRAALGLAPRPDRGNPGFAPPAEWSSLITTELPRVRAELGPHEARFMADLLRDVGAEKFSAFWRSSDEPGRAFAAAVGEPIESWTQRWLHGTVQPEVSQAGVSFGMLAWLAIAVALCTRAAGWRRDSVLGPGGSR